MSEMIERVMKALQLHGTPMDRQMARAAIEAMREPTKAMKECGHSAGWSGVIDGLKDAEEEAAEGLWQAMIDEALK